MADGSAPLEFTGERFVPGAGGPGIYLEHAHRYALAAGLCAGKRVVDVGSGEGYGVAWLARTASRVLGCELAAEPVGHAARRYEGAGNAAFVRADATALPLPDGCTDVVVCFETLEHLDDHEGLVDEAVRLLGPDGIFVVSTPDKATYTDATGEQNEFHVRELYLPEFEQLLRVRFAHVRIYGQRVAAGSLLWALDTGAAGRAYLLGGRPADGVAPEDLDGLAPCYAVAVCSQSADPVEAAGCDVSVLVDVLDSILEGARRAEELDGHLDRARAQLQALEDELREVREGFGRQARAYEEERRQVHETFGRQARVYEEELARAAAVFERLDRERDA